MRVLGVDPGSRRIGVALSDEERRVATPLCTLSAVPRESAIASIVGFLDEHAAATVVMGLPLTLEGREGEAARRARLFADALSAACDARIVMWDERLTTSAAQRSLREAGVSGPRQRAVIDQVAATLLLQSYLDATHEGDGSGPGSDTL